MATHGRIVGDDTEQAGVRARGVLWMAMRYALGRATYAVGEVCDAIGDHAHELRPSVRERMACEIEEAIRGKRAGMDMDVERWQQAVLDLRKATGPELDR